MDILITEKAGLNQNSEYYLLDFIFEWSYLINLDRIWIWCKIWCIICLRHSNFPLHMDDLQTPTPKCCCVGLWQILSLIIIIIVLKYVWYGSVRKVPNPQSVHWEGAAPSPSLHCAHYSIYINSRREGSHFSHPYLIEIRGSLNYFLTLQTKLLGIEYKFICLVSSCFSFLILNKLFRETKILLIKFSGDPWYDKFELLALFDNYESTPTADFITRYLNWKDLKRVGLDRETFRLAQLTSPKT